jgi:Tol biopolymer transport system component
LYEMLAGEPPYTGPTAQAIIAKRLREPVPRLSTVREVPPAVEQAVTKALAKAKADRFGSVGEFQRALRAPAPEARPVLSRRVVRSLLVLLVIAAAIGGRALLQKPPPPPAVHRQLTFTGNAGHPLISADGHWLAYVQGRPGEAPRLLVRDLISDAPPVVIASPSVFFWWVGFKRSGDTLAYGGEQDRIDSMPSLYSVSRAGGPAIRKQYPFYAVALSPDLDTAYQAMGITDSNLVTDTIAVLDLRARTQIRAFRLGLGAQVVGASISPDGRWLALLAVRSNATFLAVTSTDGRAVHVLVDRVPRHTTVSWNRGSTGIYYLRDLGNGAGLGAGLDLMKVVIDPGTGVPRGEPHVVVGGASIREFATVPNQNLLVYTKAPPNQKLWAMHLQPGGSVTSAKEIELGTSVYGTPDLSPDGNTVAYAQNDKGLGRLFFTPFDSGMPRPIPTPSADAWSPRWSPDGRSLAYASTEPRSPGVFVLEPPVGGQARQITSSGLAPAGRLSWSHDGRTLMFPIDLGRHYALVDVTTGKADTLVAPRETGFHLTAFSPNDHEVVAGWDPLLRGERTGRGWQRLPTPPGGGWDPLLWTRDGWIYFGHLTEGRTGEADPSGFREIWRTRVDASHAELYARLPELCSWWEISLSADARRLVCTVNKAEPDIWVAEHFDPEER